MCRISFDPSNVASHATFLNNQKSIVMKKITTIVSAAMLLLSTSAFAYPFGTGESVNKKITAAFEKKFVPSSEVNWKYSDGYYFAQFQVDNNDVSVAYNEEGELVGSSRVIRKAELPADVVAGLKDQFGDYSVCDAVTEIVLQGEKSYYVTVENKNAVLRLKSSADGYRIMIEKKAKKRELVGKVF